MAAASADTVSPRPPLMTQVQHLVSRIKKRQRWDVQTMWAYDLDLWPWIVGHTRLGTTTYDYLFSIYGPLGQHGSDWSRDLATLTFYLGGHSACGWCGSSSSIRIPSLKFVGLAIRKIWRTMCVRINGSGDPDLWPFDLETGTWYASRTKVVNLPSKFWHASPLGSRIIRYLRDGRTDGRTKLNLRLLPTILTFPLRLPVLDLICLGLITLWKDCVTRNRDSLIRLKEQERHSTI